MVDSDPRLRQPEKRRLLNGPVRVLVFELPTPNSKSPPAHVTLYDADELRQYVARQSRLPKTRNTIYIIESLNQAVIEIMGSHFNLHPSMFLDYIRSAQVPGCKKGHSSLLASTWATRGHLVMSYRELLALDEEASSLPRLRCMFTNRDIATTRVNGTPDSIGLVHRKVVTWSRQRRDQNGWDCKSELLPVRQRT